MKKIFLKQFIFLKFCHSRYNTFIVKNLGFFWGMGGLSSKILHIKLLWVSVFCWSNAGRIRVDDFKLLVNDRVIPDGCLKQSPNIAEALGLALRRQLPTNAEVHTSRFQRVWSTEQFVLAHSYPRMPAAFRKFQTWKRNSDSFLDRSWRLISA